MANEKNPFSIEYTVGLNYITPAARQKVGVAGNHNVPKLEFSVDPELRSQIQNFAGAENVFFRFDIYNAAGEVFRTESQNVVESEYSDYQFYYKLQERDTRYGGTVKVVLVLTADDGSGNVEEVFCPPALLQFVGKSHGTSKHSYTELEQKVLAAADDAAEAADYARQIKTAYDSGELKGDKGDTGEQGIQGIKGDKGEDGKDYVLTAEDKNEISALVPTHEKYFAITNDGIISLKDVYRGAAYKKLTDYDNGVGAGKIPDAVSDRGENIVGSKNHELPSDIYIPFTVNGIAVTGLAKGIFAYNDRIKRVVLQPNIKVLNGYTFCRARNLETVECTEQIETVSNCEFYFTPIKRVELPNLKGTLAQSMFKQCPLLEYVDIGDVTTLGKSVFHMAYNLKEIKIASPVESIGEGAFFYCVNLRTVDNIVAPNITKSIGKGAFMMCRPTYEWNSLTNCDFGDYATSEQMHNCKFWLQDDGTPIPFTPCENKALSFLSQFDSRWSDVVTNPDIGRTFAYGCGGFAVMGAWCSLNNVNVDDARDFLDICNKYGTEFKLADDGTDAGDFTADKTFPFYNAMGLSYRILQSAEFNKLTSGVARLIYDSLAEGKYVVLITPNSAGNYMGHVLTVTGITPMGELIIHDSADSGAWQLGIRGHITGKVPIQNLLNIAAYPYGRKGAILGKAVT